MRTYTNFGVYLKPCATSQARLAGKVLGSGMPLEMCVEVVGGGECHRLALALVNVAGVHALVRFLVEGGRQVARQVIGRAEAPSAPRLRALERLDVSV